MKNNKRLLSLLIAIFALGMAYVFYLFQHSALVIGGIDFAQALMMGCVGIAIYSAPAALGIDLYGKKDKNT